MEATTAPVPMKKLCIAKPVVRCSEGRLSPTKARNGSIEMLMEASMIHSIPAATHRVGELGMITRAREARMAPTRKYGRLRPNRFHVRSLRYPTIGCTRSPVTGAAIHRMGMFSTLAPRVSKIRLTFAFCRANPNWMPRKPKLMFQMSQNDSFGLGRSSVGDEEALDSMGTWSSLVDYRYVSQ